MKPVLCCVDSSASAPGVLAVARELAEGLGLPLVVLHVAPPTAAPGVSAAPAGRRRLQAAELEESQALLEGLAEQAGLGDDVELRAEIGLSADRIVDVCAELGAELAVLGSRGHGDLRSAVLGSVSNAVAIRASCPVVIVNPTVIDARQGS